MPAYNATTGRVSFTGVEYMTALGYFIERGLKYERDLKEAIRDQFRDQAIECVAGRAPLINNAIQRGTTTDEYLFFEFKEL